MGHCQYRFNASELYQRTRPGHGIETSCGALTFPAVDEPEIVPVRMPNPSGSAEAVYDYVRTGRFLPRGLDDPHCPDHGGSPEPPPPPVSLADLQAAHDAYLALASRFTAGNSDAPELQGVPLPALPAGQPDPAPVTAEQLAAASEHLAALAAQAGGGVSDAD